MANSIKPEKPEDRISEFPSLWQVSKLAVKRAKWEWSYCFLYTINLKWGIRQAQSHVWNEKDHMRHENTCRGWSSHPLQSLLLRQVQSPSKHVQGARRSYWNMHMFTLAPETEAQKVIKYIVSGRWHWNHDGPDGLQKSGNVPGSIHHHLLDLSYSCGNDPFLGLPHRPHITALNTTYQLQCCCPYSADRVVLCNSGFTFCNVVEKT